MKPIRDIRSLFSRYELAATGQFFHLAFFATGVALLLIGGGTAAALLSLLLSALLGIAAYVLIRCPTCGKSPMRRARGEVAWALYLMAPGRLWPERQCSECGAALDEEPND